MIFDGMYFHSEDSDNIDYSEALKSNDKKDYLFVTDNDGNDICIPVANIDTVGKVYREGPGYQFYVEIVNGNNVYFTSKDPKELFIMQAWLFKAMDLWFPGNTPSDVHKQMFVETDTEDVVSIAISSVGNIRPSGVGYQYQMKLVNSNVYNKSSISLEYIREHRANTIQTVLDWSDTQFQSIAPSQGG